MWSRKRTALIEFSLVLGIIIFLNIIFSQYFFRIDLTEDKRYSVSEYTKEALKEIKEPVVVTVFLEGDLTPDYLRLKRAIKETLEEFRAYTGNNLQYKFTNPNAIEEKNHREQFIAALVQKGVQYKYDLVEEGGKREEKVIFPGALISFGEKEVPVNFLKGNKTLPEDQQLNQGVEGVEYELMSAIRQLTKKESGTVAFVEGHGELPKEEVADFSSSLSGFYNVDRIKLNDVKSLAPYKVLIIAKPDTAFTEQEKFKLDQYVVNGGKLLLFIDALDLRTDSLVNGKTYAFAHNLNLDDIFFKYGFRLNGNIIQDMSNGMLRVETGNEGQTEVVPWPYYPIVYNFSKHPAVKNLDAVLMKYIGTIDTVKADGITKTPLAFTSDRTRIIGAPHEIDLNETRTNQDPNSFDKGVLPVAYLLEGKFTSAFKNRPTPVSGTQVQSNVTASSIIVCSDGDVIRNGYDYKRKKPFPLGYDPELRYMFSNKDFALNAVDYLAGEKIINIREKEIKLRPLDKVRIQDEKTEFQILNLVVPVILLIAFGFGRFYMRKKKYETIK